MQDITLQMFYSALPGVGAVFLSLYNWYTLRQGSRIRPLKIVNYGLWSVKTDQKSVKHLFMPVILDNSAIKPGLVTDIAISFESPNGQRKPIAVNKRIELTMPGSTGGKTVFEFKQTNTKELVPFYPVPINGQEGTMVMLDCFDPDGALALDTDCLCIIDVYYGSNRSSSVSFPFRLSSEDFEKARNGITWLRA